MKKTHKIFHDTLPLIQKNIKTYQSYLQKKSAGYEVKERNFHKTRSSITAWNNATVTFLDFIRSGGNDKLSALFKKYFPSDIEAGNNEPPFSCDEEMESLQGLQKIINIEGHLHEPLPLTILEKLAAGKIVTESEKKDLGVWIDKLNKLKSIFHVSLFHDAMVALVNYLSTLQYPEPPSLASLELGLSDRGLKLFTEEEDEHIKWRKELKPGDRLRYLGKEITLDEQIGKKYYDKDSNLVFGIKEDPEKVVYIGRNRAVLGIREKINKDYSGGLRSAEFIEIDPLGRFAIMEKLYDSLDHYQWKSKQGSAIPRSDRDFINPIAELVAWLIQNDITPDSLSPKHLMFKEKKVLRYTKVCLLGEFDYTALEDFLFECSNGHRSVFCELMNLSRLHAHPCQKFFKKMLGYALEGTEKKSDTVASLDKITDPKVVNRGKTLYDDIRQMKESCCRKICQGYRLDSNNDLLEKVKKAINQFYYSTNSSGILWPTMEEEVVASVVKSMKLQSLASR